MYNTIGELKKAISGLSDDTKIVSSENIKFELLPIGNVCNVSLEFIEEDCSLTEAEIDEILNDEYMIVE